MSNNIPVFKPSLNEQELVAARESLELGWLGPGSYVKEFEERIAHLIGVSSNLVVTVNTGTSAIHLALVVLNIKPGDEVITPSFNNIERVNIFNGLQNSGRLGEVDYLLDSDSEITSWQSLKMKF